jgi:hypothetical protein
MRLSFYDECSLSGWFESIKFVEPVAYFIIASSLVKLYQRG